MLLTAKPGINLLMSYIIQSIQKLLVLLGLLLRLTVACVLQQGSIVNHSSDLTSIPATSLFAACLLATNFGKLLQDQSQRTAAQMCSSYMSTR